MNLSFPILALLIFARGISGAVQQQPAPRVKKNENPNYPRVNLAPYYEVDPSWPQRPPNMPWKDVPGIAVDKRDNIWIFTRTNPAVQVFTADGNFVRALGEGVVS